MNDIPSRLLGLLLLIATASAACSADRTDWEFTLFSTAIPPLTREDGPPQRQLVALPDNPALGVGLSTSVLVSLQQFESLHSTAPRGLKIIPDNPSSLEIVMGGTYSGIVGTGEIGSGSKGSAAIVSLRPTAAGKNHLRFVADNTEEVGFLDFEAKAPAAFRELNLWSGDTLWKEPEASIFAGSELLVDAQYFYGEQRVLGIGELSLDDPSGQAQFDGGILRAGNSPGDFSLRAGGEGPAVTVHVIDGDAVSDLKISGSMTSFGETAVVKQYVDSLIKLDALDGARTVLGYPHPPFRVESSGDSVVVTELSPFAGYHDRFDLAAKGPGAATVHISMDGLLGRDLQVQVVP